MTRKLSIELRNVKKEFRYVSQLNLKIIAQEKSGREECYGYITMVAGVVSLSMQWGLGAYVYDSD